MRFHVADAEALTKHDHDVDARVASSFQNPIAVRNRGRHRLIDQNVLACCGRGQCLCRMHRVRRADQNGIYIVSLKQRFYIRFVIDLVVGRQRLCATATGDRDQFCMLQIFGYRLGIRSTHKSGADDAYAHYVHSLALKAISPKLA